VKELAEDHRWGQSLASGATQVHVQLPVGKCGDELVGEVDRQGRLPDPWLAGDYRDHHRLAAAGFRAACGGQVPAELCNLLFPGR
jgi:hypothetical protein